MSRPPVTAAFFAAALLLAADRACALPELAREQRGLHELQRVHLRRRRARRAGDHRRHRFGHHLGHHLGAVPARHLVDVPNADPTDGNQVQLYDCNSTNAQQWTYDTPTKEYRALGKCLDASGAGTANGTKLILYTCHGGTNQQWSHP